MNQKEIKIKYKKEIEYDTITIPLFIEFIKEMGWKFRRNKYSKTLWWKPSDKEGWRVLDDGLLNRLVTEVRQKHTNMSADRIWSVVGSENIALIHDPIEEYFNNLVYDPNGAPDGDYFVKLCDYIFLENDIPRERERLQLSLKKWFVGAIKTVLHKHYVHKSAIVFQGPSGIGKTPFIEALLPEELADMYKSSPSLDMDSKDSKIDLCECLLINIDEIDDFLKNRTNREGWKSYSTMSSVKVRAPYGRQAVRRQRIASFWGTCNQSTFLNDPTGTQRFTVFSINHFKNQQYYPDMDEKELVENFPIDQLWAYALKLYKDGFNPNYTLKEREINEASNEPYKYDSAEKELLEKYFSPGSKEDGEFYNATTLTIILREKHPNIPVSRDRVGKALIRLGFKKCSKWDTENQRGVSGYWVKENSLGVYSSGAVINSGNKIPF